MAEQNTLRCSSWLVYKHISPSNKVYVGITHYENPNKRWRYGNGYDNCILFKRAIRKYGWKNFKHIIVSNNLSEKEAKSLEQKLIKYYKQANISYNITDGGDGHLGCTHTPSEETKKLWSAQRKGRKLSPEWKRKISKSLKGRRIDKSVSLLGAKRAKETLSKPVIQMTLDGNFIKEHSSLHEAAKSLNIKYVSDIVRCCQGKRKSRAGYRWKYKEENL